MLQTICLYSYIFFKMCRFCLWHSVLLWHLQTYLLVHIFNKFILVITKSGLLCDDINLSTIGHGKLLLYVFAVNYIS